MVYRSSRVHKIKKGENRLFFIFIETAVHQLSFIYKHFFLPFLCMPKTITLFRIFWVIEQDIYFFPKLLNKNT